MTSDRAKEQNGKGFSFVGIHRYEDALACFEEAARLDPKDAEAHENKALCLGVFGRNDEALACFEEAVGLGTGDLAATHVNMGRCLLDLRRNVEALASFEAALGLEPGHLDSTYCKGICLVYLQRNEEARACLEPIMVPEDMERFFANGFDRESVPNPKEASSRNAAEHKSAWQADVLEDKGIEFAMLLKNPNARLEYALRSVPMDSLLA